MERQRLVAKQRSTGITGWNNVGALPTLH